MKRLFLFLTLTLAVLVATPASSGAQGFWEEVWKGVKTNLPKVSFPAVEQVAGRKITIDGNGIEIERYNLVVRNPLPAVAIPFAYEKKIAKLGPGGIAVDDRKAQVHEERVPIMTFYYEDAGNGRLGGFIGISADQANFIPGQFQSQAITLGQNLIGPDGPVNLSSLGQAGPQTADVLEHPAHLPRKWDSGTTGIQAGNASRDVVRLSVNGHTLKFLKPEGGFGCWEWKSLQGWGWSVTSSVQLDYLRENGVGPDGKPVYVLIKSIGDIHLNLNSWGIEGRQIIIGPPETGALVY